jgi:hypothetical protein
MSAAHRTGRAKASAVIDWLMTALGARKGQNADSHQQQQQQQQRGGMSGGQAGEADGESDGPTAEGTVDPAGPKFLVFAHHKTVMNRLAAALEGAGQYGAVGYVRIDGSTDPEDRWARLHSRQVCQLCTS